MSQSSATESDHSEYQLKAPSTDEVSHSLAAHNLKGSQSSDSNGPYEFDDLIYDLAEFFLAFRKIEFEEWVYTVEDRRSITAFMELLFIFISTTSTGHFTVSEEDRYICCLEALWNTKFLSSLLGFRSVIEHVGNSDRVFRQRLISQRCCQIIGSLEKMVISLAGQQAPRELPPSIKERQQEDMERVAAQLPDRLYKFPNVLSSSHSPPAAKRLALAILFGISVVESAGDAWGGSEIDPPHLLKCLRHFIHDTDSNATRNIFAQDDEGTRILFAMIWSSYSTVQRVIEHKGGPSTFQPHTLSILLSMLRCVFADVYPLDSGAPFYIQTPDTAQIIILRWGYCIPFVWSNWEDARVLDFDLIINLTANWLCRLDQQFLRAPRPASFAEDEFTLTVPSKMTFDGAILSNRGAAIIAISRQLKFLAKNEMQNMDAEMRLLHISRCTQIIKTLKEADEAALNCVALIEDFVMILFTLDASEKQLPVKGEILDLLCSMNKEDMGNALGTCRSDSQRRLEMKIEDAVGGALRNLSSRNRPGETVRLTPCSLVDVLALLNLICLICSTGSTICLTASVVSLLSTVINVIESGTLPFACSLYAADLRAAMLSCLASFETLHRSSGGASDSSSYRILHRLWDDNSAFALALEANVWSHLPLSSAFATYVMSSTKPLADDRLLCIEAWNYLRDTMLLTLPQAYKASDQTANACLKNVCRGLKHTLNQADDRTARYIRASPMLLNLSDALSTAVHRRGEGNNDVAYANLVVACEELLGAVNKKTQDNIP